MDGLQKAFVRTDEFAEKLVAQIRIPLLSKEPKVRLCHIICSLALEHWGAAVGALTDGHFSSAVVLHRCQFEAIVRGVWLLFAASEDEVKALDSELSHSNANAASKLPSATKMLDELEGRIVPIGALVPLQEFRDISWKHMNSYVHTGLHPISRHEQGYPPEMVLSVLRNANGLALHTAMFITVLTSRPFLQYELIAMAKGFPECVPVIADIPKSITPAT